ncbi:MAG TPA: tetratricopeptide repeat protein [Terriglobales bacterium]|nr:tetratricopeptide repeat protein [Terriglobales bacterium]
MGLFVVPLVPNRQLGLTLLPQNQAQTTHVSSEPEFFDKPQFEVAGVTDTTNLGGHGSDVAVRTTDTLAKETSQLRNSSSAAITPSMAGNSAAERDFGSYLSSGKALLSRDLPKQATDPLETAFQLNPESTEAAFELAHADLLSGRYQRARINLLSLASRQGSAPVLELLAETYERLDDPLAASRNYQRAAELEPSETNLFHWGSELLLHHAAEPAANVFTSGNRLFPHSTRMLIGLAIAQYALGLHDGAMTRLCSASDLDPNDPQPYLFLGRIQAAETAIAPCSITTLERFETLQPQNALAKYYLAVTLMKEARETSDPTLAKAEDLLLKSVALQPKFDLGYLALGDLYSRRHQSPEAISALRKATAANPDSPEAHYRLAQLYRITNHTQEANRELQEYKQLSAKNAEQFDKERHELPQLVYELKSQSEKKPR